MSTQKSACAVWDFTLSKELNPNHWELKRWLVNNCKLWGFQGEIGGKTGFVHWQGRFSLSGKIKHRKATMLKAFPFKIASNALSVTSNANRGGDSFYEYMSKDNTAIEGERWTDKDKYVPRQIREITKLYKWQQTIVDSLKEWDKDHINVVICPTGFTGKSTLAMWCQCNGLGFCVPPVATLKDMMEILMAVKTEKAYFIDIPRAFKGDWEPEFWAGIECIKRGKIFDLRYRYNEKIIDAPHIWVFMNRMPNTLCITKRRWKLWNIVEGELRGIKMN